MAGNDVPPYCSRARLAGAARRLYRQHRGDRLLHGRRICPAAGAQSRVYGIKRQLWRPAERDRAYPRWRLPDCRQLRREGHHPAWRGAAPRTGADDPRHRARRERVPRCRTRLPQQSRSARVSRIDADRLARNANDVPRTIGARHTPTNCRFSNATSPDRPQRAFPSCLTPGSARLARIPRCLTPGSARVPPACPPASPLEARVPPACPLPCVPSTPRPLPSPWPPLLVGARQRCAPTSPSRPARAPRPSPHASSLSPHHLAPYPSRLAPRASRIVHRLASRPHPPSQPVDRIRYCFDPMLLCSGYREFIYFVQKASMIE
jgi:hypothetical protein